MTLRGIVLVIVLSLVAFTVLAAVPGPSEIPAVTPRRLLETMALLASLAAVVTWICATVAAWRRGGYRSWRALSREQHVGLLLTASMSCLFTGSVVRMVFPPTPLASAVSVVLVTISIPGNLAWLHLRGAERHSGTCGPTRRTGS